MTRVFSMDLYPFAINNIKKPCVAVLRVYHFEGTTITDFLILNDNLMFKMF